VKMTRMLVVAGIALALCAGLVGCVSAPKGEVAPTNPVVGTWNWFNGGVVTISDNLTMVHVDGTDIQDTGTWAALPGPGTQVRLTWASGWIDTLTLSPDGRTLEGTNQDGSGVSGTR
jgi:hypothetical protein